MRPGPRPTPVSLKLARGNPGKRPVLTGQARPTKGATLPSDLSGAAKAEWRRLRPELERLGLLTVLDRAALSAYCEAWADFVWAVKTIRTSGRITKAGNGTCIPHPAVAIKRQSMQRIRELANEFGFSPAARARIDLEEPGGDPGDDEKWFGKKRGPRPAPPPAPARRTRRRA